MTSTCQGHVTFPVTWPFDSPSAISYGCFTPSLYLQPFSRYWAFFYIWVTTLTLLGHVTSSVTWLVDPPYVISYWCPIVTEPLSLTVFEIFSPNTRANTHTHTHANTVLRSATRSHLRCNRCLFTVQYSFIYNILSATKQLVGLGSNSQSAMLKK